MVLLVVALILCVLLSAFFSSTETAYTTVSKVRLKIASEGKNRKKALNALELSEDYDRLLTTILVGNNIVNIAATAIATVLFTSLMGSDLGATVSTVVMTVLILLFGEVSPKMLAKQFPEKIAMAVSGPMMVLMKLLSPINSLFIMWRKMLSKLFHPDEDDSAVEEELMTMVEDAREEGDMEAAESELIRSAIAFNDQDALYIMTPRVDVCALPEDSLTEDAENLFRETGYSRIPVYHEDLDHIIGVLNEKDFHTALREGQTSLRQMVRNPVFAPANLKIPKLLKLFQQTKTHLIVLVDEYGGTEGIVTMEDVLEELVGEIYDEQDEVCVDINRLEDGTVVVDGLVELGELLDMYGMPDRFEADTVGGWAAEMLERIPSVGDRFEVSGLTVCVTAMEKRRVTSVSVSGTYIPEEENAEE